MRTKEEIRQGIERTVQKRIDTYNKQRDQFKQRFCSAVTLSGMSMKDLAIKTGIPISTLGKYLQGSVFPRSSNLKKITEALGIGKEFFE